MQYAALKIIDKKKLSRVLHIKKAWLITCQMEATKDHFQFCETWDTGKSGTSFVYFYAVASIGAPRRLAAQMGENSLFYHFNSECRNPTSVIGLLWSLNCKDGCERCDYRLVLVQGIQSHCVQKITLILSKSYTRECPLPTSWHVCKHFCISEIFKKVWG